MSEQSIGKDTVRQRAAVEVLELGEMLFDTAIEATMRQAAVIC